MPLARVCSRYTMRLVGLCLLTLALTGPHWGCAPPVLSLSSQADPPGTSYGTSLDRWSRHGRILSKTEFDTQLVVYATLRAPAFQRAYVDKYLKTYAIVDHWEKARVEKEQAEQTQHGLSLFLLTKTHSASWNDLRLPAGKWRLSLLDGEGREVQADRVDTLSTRQAVEQTLLGEPTDAFTKLWSVHFPSNASDGQPFPAPSTRKISLRVAGPLGQTELLWLLQ